MGYRYRSAYRPSYRPTYGNRSYGSSGRSYGGGARSSAPAVDYMKTAKESAPPSSPTMLVFPWETSSFNTSTFSSKKTNDVLTQQKFNEILEKIKTCYFYDAKKDGSILPVVICVAILLFFGCLVLYIILLIKGKIGYALMSFFGGFFLLAVLIISAASCEDKAHQSKLKKRGKEMKKLLYKVNEETQKLGVVFNSGIYGGYITLEIFGKAIPMNTEMPTPKGLTNNKPVNKSEKKDEKLIIPDEEPLKNKAGVNSNILRKPSIAISRKKSAFEVKTNNNNIEIYEPGNIGYASVVDPTKDDNKGIVKPYNPPILDVNVKR